MIFLALLFLGRDPFTDLPNSVVSKRDKIPHSKQLRAWEKALEQAQKALPLNRQQRKLCYVFKYNDDLQRVPKQIRSPEPTYKKREKASRKPTKVRPRLTRRSCLLGRSKEIMNEGDYFQSMNTTEHLTANVSILTKESKSVTGMSNDLNGDFKLEDSVDNAEKVTLRRRGRSAGGLSIDGSFVFDALQVHPKIEEDRKESSIVSFNKGDLTDEEFVSVEEDNDFKLGKEKVKVTKLSTGYRGKEMSRKRQREHGKDPILKTAKKIKVEIVPRKHNVFEIIPKKMKNKQTQTPERKTKRGVMTKKSIQRKLELTKKTIKTKETYASKKFSRKLKAAAGPKGSSKKDSHDSRNKQKRETRQATNNCAPKQAVKEKKGINKKPCKGLEAGINEGIAYNIDYDDDNSKHISKSKVESVDSEKNIAQKRGRGRPRKLHRTENEKSSHEMDLTDAMLAQTSIGNCKNQERHVDDNPNSPNSPIGKTGPSETTDPEAKIKAKRGSLSTNDFVRRRELRGDRLTLSGDIVGRCEVRTTENKHFKVPPRRSIRHPVPSNSSENNCVFVCKVSQLPEIDDIVEGNSEDNSRSNRINGCINKGLLLKVLSNIDAEIPIELECTEDHAKSHIAGEGNNTVVEETLPISDDSKLCNDHVNSSREGTASHQENPNCNSANVEKHHELELHNGSREIVENYMQFRSNENLPTCSVMESVKKHVNYDNGNLVTSCNPEMSVEFSHHVADAKSHVHVSDLGRHGKNGLAGNKRVDMHSCIEDTQTCEVQQVTSHASIENNIEMESVRIGVNDTRTFEGSHHLDGFISGGHGHEYFSNDVDRSNAVFPADNVNHVDDADLYLNDDDIGLPVTRGRQLCVSTNRESDSVVTPSLTEMDPSRILGKVSNAEAQFEKPNLNDNELEVFQSAFGIPSLSLPDLTQSAPYYQRRLDNPSGIASISSTTANIDHISSRYFPIEETFTDALASQTTSHVGSMTPQSGSCSQCETLSSQMSDVSVPSSDPLINTSNSAMIDRSNDRYGIFEQWRGNTGVNLNENTSLIVSSVGSPVLNGNVFHMSKDVEDHTPNPVHNRGPYVDCNRELCEDKRNVLPVTLTDSQTTVSSDGNGEFDNNHGENAAKQQLQPNNNNLCELTKNENVILNRKKSLLNSQSVAIVCNNIKKSPAVYDLVTNQEGNSDEDYNESTAAQEFNGDEGGDIPELDSNTVSPNSSLSEKQSPSEKDVAMDSTKINDDSSQVGNSLKRQRKRKAMSDFHVGLAFDEILSNRGRASDGDKGSPKLSLAKKKRDNIKRIDYEEKVKSGKEADGTEKTLMDENTTSKEIVKSQNRGKVDEGRRSVTKNRSVCSSEEQTAIVESEFVDIYHDQKSPDGTGEAWRVEDAAGFNPGVSPDKKDLVDVSAPEKKKRGRKPKVKDRKEDSPSSKQVSKPVKQVNKPVKQVNKPVKQVSGKSPIFMEDIAKSMGDSVIMSQEGGNAKEIENVNKPRKKKSAKSKWCLKLKGTKDEKKEKRKYVKRKVIQKDKVLCKSDSSENQKDKTEDSVQNNDSTVALKEDKSPILDLVEQEVKPKRHYNKKKKINDGVSGKVEKSTGKNTVRKYNRKSITKGKQESTDNTELVTSVEKKRKGKKKLGLTVSDSVPYESSKTAVLAAPKKYKKKASIGNEKGLAATVHDGKNRSNGNKLSTQKEDIVCNSAVVLDETALASENIAESKLDGESNPQRSHLPFLDSKQVRPSEKLETRSNLSDETASISGKETDDCGKMKKDSICTICEQGDGLIACNGVCYSSFHPDCLGLSTVPDKFYCDECLTGNHSCFLCKETGNLRKCSYSMCGKYYHDACTQKMRGCKLENNKLTCPLHSCGTCANDKENSSTSKKRILRCVRCPTAYHASRCLVAGCVQLTNTLMVCHKHFVPQKSKPHHTHYNVSWCFVCSTGGMLVCCDSCPAAFHPGCVEDLDGVPDETWQCDSCREGKKPLYGDLVWVKYGFWR